MTPIVLSWPDLRHKICGLKKNRHDGEEEMNRLMAVGPLSQAWLICETRPAFGSIAGLKKVVGVGHVGREVELI